MAKAARAVGSGARIVFYYDVVCPFAYMTSTVIEDLARRAGATVEWTPVLLGGLYEATSAAQGKAGSATDIMAPSKLSIIGQDLRRQLNRRGVPFRSPTYHPQKTVYAMRLLAAIPENSLRVSLSHAFYKAYWYNDQDLSDIQLLEDISKSYGVMSGKELLESDTASKKLRENTSEAVMRGAFGVPGLFVNDQFYWGTDRLFFVERALGVDAHPERLMSPPSSGTATLTFYFDYSSPWSYLGFQRLGQLAKDVYPINLKIEWVPILLGALFKQIGTPNVPGTGMNTAKLNYYQKDLQDWCKYAGVKLVFPQAFPLRTVLPLRVTLASGCDPALMQAIYTAAWQRDLNIGDKAVLQDVLGGGTSLIESANTENIKSQLFANTTRAVDAGVCGVPSFQVNGGPIIWGQDKLNTVADMICGWEEPQSKL